MHYSIYGLWCVHCWFPDVILVRQLRLLFNAPLSKSPLEHEIDFVDQTQRLQYHSKTGKKHTIMGKTGDYPVRNLISFDALENPSWHATSTRSNARERRTVTEMITQIAEYHKRWQRAIVENTYSEELIKKVQEQLEWFPHKYEILPSIVDKAYIFLSIYLGTGAVSSQFYFPC